MKYRTLLLAAAVVASVPTSHVVHAQTASIHAPVHAMFAKEKTVKLSLHNGSSSPFEVKLGDELMTVAAGQTVSLNLPIGTRIVANSNTSTLQAGTLITQVSKELNGAVLHVR